MLVTKTSCEVLCGRELDFTSSVELASVFYLSRATYSLNCCTERSNMATIDPLLEQIMAVLSCNRSVLDIDYGAAAVKVGKTGAHAAGNTCVYPHSG